jgi:hypothetical protein
VALASFAAAGVAVVAAAPMTAATAAAPAPTSIPAAGIPKTQFERTYIMVKPDGVQRGLLGEIIRRFEARGFTLVALKLVQPTKAHMEKHYEDLSTKAFFPPLVK